MNICFDHCGQDYQAIIFYNFKEIKDCFILKFPQGFNVPITFFKEKDAWGSDSELQIRFPDTYLNIQKAIVEAFKVKEGLDDVHFKEYSIDSNQWKEHNTNDNTFTSL